MGCLDLQMFLLCVSAATNGTNVTYPGFGTFTDMDYYDPINRPIIALPDNPDEMDLKFSLYTPVNRNVPDLIRYNESFTMKRSNFNSNLETKVIVHGFLDNNVVPATWMLVMKDRFLTIGSYNVILTDWSGGNFLPYTQSVANARIAGLILGKMIRRLCKIFQITERSFHLLGHSLGSHVVGYAGKYLNGRLGQITGFDPAGPLFEGVKNHSARLWRTDAEFVDVIHTDTGELLRDFGLGLTSPCGHVDIYPNGGRTQPGCDQERFTSIAIRGLYEGVRRLVACNHNRVVEFYLESITAKHPEPVAFACKNYETFQAGNCTDCGTDGSRCIIFGPKAKQQYQRRYQNGSMKFFMVTGDSPKYFRFQYLVKIRMENGNQTEEEIPEGIITFSFNDRHGKRQDVVFNEKIEKFRPGREYRRVLALNLDPKKFPPKIGFKWNTDEYISWSTTIEMSVSNMEFIPLITGIRKRFRFE